MRALRNIIHIIIFFLCAFSLTAQEQATTIKGDPVAGEKLFKMHCAACHNKNMKDDMTGPALAGFQERWADYPREDLYAWVHNSQKLIAEGHPHAVQLWNEWKPVVMTSFTSLSEQQLEDIFSYIKGVATGKIGGQKKAAGQEVVVVKEEADNSFLYVILAIVLFGLAIVLSRIISVLNAMVRTQETGIKEQPRTIKDILTSRTVIGFVVFAIIVLGGYTTVDTAINIGRQQGYQPEQPIKFSHATHAGLHQIQCQYCHDGARRSMHSVIPAANTCMNCHRAIKSGSQYGTAEITKIFASIGYNPNSDSYIEDYESLSQDSIESIYKKWIADEYMKDAGISSLDSKGENLVRTQWKGIVDALTNPQKEKIQGPIEWVRIHNLPDHVFFSHEQHVGVGEVTCEHCHGKVKEMEVVYQAKPLSMGWCVNCHRQSEVAGMSNGNKYYLDAYKTYVEQLKNGKVDKITVKDIGGVECQKCHY